jgi:hypothetical protein
MNRHITPDGIDEEHAERLSTGIAALADGETDGDTYLAHGLALAADSVTYGQSRERTYWSNDVVETATEMLDGAHIVANHPNDDEVGIEHIVGQVTRTAFEPGVGVLWEGEIDDPEVAELIENGRVDASPYLYRRLGEFSDERDAHVVEEILGVRDLGVVRDGAGDGTGIEAGASDLAEATAEALSHAFPAGTSKVVENETTVEMAHEERIEELQEALATRDERIESLESEVETLRRPYVEALTEGSNLSPEDVSVDTDGLVERFGDDDGKLTAAPLSSAPPTDEPTETEALSAEDEQRVEALEQRIDTFADRPGMSEHVEALEAELAELTGEK